MTCRRVDVGDVHDVEKTPHVEVVPGVTGQDALSKYRCGQDEVLGPLPKQAQASPTRYTDGTSETLRSGDAYYIRPGHNAHVDEDVELVEFTKADDTPGINTIEA